MSADTSGKPKGVENQILIDTMKDICDSNPGEYERFIGMYKLLNRIDGKTVQFHLSPDHRALLSAAVELAHNRARILDVDCDSTPPVIVIAPDTDMLIRRTNGPAMPIHKKTDWVQLNGVRIEWGTYG